MAFAAKLLRCIDCRKNFTYSIEEQEFHASRGFPNVPGRCPSCRQVKKTGLIKDENISEDFSSRKKAFPVTCTLCGKATRVPFQPRQNEPVYCSDCYVKSKVRK